MTWYPIAFLPPQIENSSGQPYSGAVLKAYAANTNTVIPLATDYTGVTTTASMLVNASGYPTYQGTIVIPHVQQNYKMALYPDQASADANSGAIWTIDNNQIASATNSPFVQYFDGNGVDATFTLSENLGNDEEILMVFSDRAIQTYTANSDFATDTIWTKGAGWTIGAGVATAAGAISTALQQNAQSPIIQGQTYTVEFTVTASAGTVTPSVGGNAGTTRGVGTWRENIVAGATQVIAFTGVAFTGTLDNASVKATGVAQRLINRADEITLVGNQLTLQNIPPSGTKNVIVFAPSLLLGAANNAAAAAATSEANALNYKNQAQASAVNAANYAAALNGTSTTSLLIGTGVKNLVTQTGKQFTPGSYITLASAANVSNVMFGQIQSYNTLTGDLSVSVSAPGGSGTFSDWLVSISGAQGVSGGPVSNGTYGQITVTGGGTVWTLNASSVTPAQMSDAVLLQHGQCILQKNGSNVTLTPKNGKYLIINGVPQAVPSVGVSLAPTGLTVSTLYYIYAFMNTGVMTLEASTTGHSTDATTGVEIKTGDATRTLVGMVRPITGPAFQDDITQRFVRSYFNSPPMQCKTVSTANFTTISTSYVRNTNIPLSEFLIWANEVADFSLCGGMSNATASVASLSDIGFNGITPEGAVCHSGNLPAGATFPLSCRCPKRGLTEGYNYANSLLRAAAGTANQYHAGGDTVCTIQGVISK